MIKNSVYVICLLFLSACSEKQIADLIVINGNIATMNDNEPSAEAIAIKDGKIIAIGSNEDILKYKHESTKEIDADNQFVMPGLIDGHAHFSSLGNSLMQLRLSSTKNWSEIIKVVKDKIEKSENDIWITGQGWHQEKWNEPVENATEGYPSHEALSAVSPNNPVFLSHASGHAVFANAKAMEIAGITDETPDPEGGKIVRDKDGKAIGVFIETAEALITKKYNDYKNQLSEEERHKEWLHKIDLAETECLQKGLTSFQDAGSFFEEIAWYEALAKAGELDIRLWAMISSEEVIDDKTLAGFPKIGIGNHFFTCRAIKGYADGALGSRGAWLLKSYEDKPNHFGENITPLADLKSNADFAAKFGLQMCIHAIGDKANREILNIYEDIFAKHKNANNWRWRIEHAQHVNINDIPRFAKLGIIPSMQSVHCTSDAIFVPTRLGKLRAAQESYAWRKFIENGSIIVNGTDSPVEDVDPIKNFYAAVTRKISGTNDSFYPEHCMTRLEALKSLTINNAYGGFEEQFKGSLEVKKYADIVILSNDLLKCDEEDIITTQVLYTIVNGEVKYQKIKN
ncbi:MAG: amidohydrolase [Saprospiraceae bacterium]